MKLTQLFSGLLAIGMLTACSAELQDEPDKVLANETRTFVKISLVSTDGSTRSKPGEFDDNLFDTGTQEENLINKIMLLFYDEGQNYVGSAEITVNEKDKENLSFTGEDADLTISRILTSVAEVNLPENSNHPAFVVAFVNPSSAASDLVNKEKLEDLAKIIRAGSTISTSGFTMNNSAYYDENLGQPLFATRVNFTSQFFKTKEEAEDAKKDDIVDITVERVQAKVSLENFAGINVDDYKSNAEGEYVLQFVPENWFVNATEKNTFLIKNYRVADKNYAYSNTSTLSPFNDAVPSMDFSYLQSRFSDEGRRSQINEQRRQRSYWAIDPTYFFTESALYPSMSYEVKNGKIANTNGKDFSLRYLSYNQGADIRDDKFNIKNSIYCLENTMNVATLMSNRAKASMTSVVLLGHYIVKKGSETIYDGVDKKDTFYIHHDAADTKTVLLSDNDAIDFFLKKLGTLLYYPVNEDDKVVYKPLSEVIEEATDRYTDFILKHPFKINANLVGPTVISEQWRTIAFSDNNAETLNKYYVYDRQSDGTYGYIPLDKTRLEGMLTNIYSACGLLERFKDCKAYFNVPLKHIFNLESTSNQFDADKVVLGDYGVVRNHAYNLTINSIKGLGTGIGDLDQPIVPPTEVDKYYISAKINVLKWRLVDQTVNL